MSTNVTNTVVGTDGSVSRTEHALSWTGLAGGMLWSSIGALFILVVGYATTGWYAVSAGNGRSETGLWEQCICASVSSPQDYFRATQAFATMALITLIATTAMSACYLLVHFLPKKLLLFGAIGCFAASALFLLIAVCVFGAETSKLAGNPSYSFAFAVISMIISIAGSVITFMQMRKSGSL